MQTSKGRPPTCPKTGPNRPVSLSIGAAFGALTGAWLVSGDRRPVGLAVELAVSTQGMAAALALDLVGCGPGRLVPALALGILGVPQARWAQRRCRGTQPAGAAFAARPCEVGKGGAQKSDAPKPETDL